MRTFIISLKIFLVLTVVTGVIYPLLITGIAQCFLPLKANGSLIYKNNKAVGSELIGQNFDTTIYFSSRPSAINYNPMPSGGSNFGLSSMRLKNQVNERKKNFIAFNKLDSLTIIPAEMLFASASGLDPHISPEAALLQVNRISNARQLNNSQKQQLLKMIKDQTELPQLSILGETRINVLILNLELDSLCNKTEPINKSY